MRVSLLFNTKSGKGKAGPLAELLSRALISRGHDVSFFDVSTSVVATRDAVSKADIVCVLGGDGSVHHALPHLMNSHAALYHVPLGTENLFSRDWDMTADPETVARAVDGNRTELIDCKTRQTDRTELRKRATATSSASTSMPEAWLDKPSGLRATQSDDAQERARIGPAGESALRELRITPSTFRHNARFWLAMGPSLLVALTFGGKVTFIMGALMALAVYVLDRIGERIRCDALCVCVF